jgi:hypothetical protein
MTQTIKSTSLRGATAGVAKSLGLSPKSVRKAVQEAKLAQQHINLAQSRSHVSLEREGLFNQIRIGGTDSQFSRLTYNGMLPVSLPNGIKLAILPDLHAPAHHKGIMWAVKEWLFDYKPDILILIGDVADIFALSAWPKSPRIPESLGMEITSARELIDELIRVSGCRHCFIIMGNHEDRIRRWLMNFGQKVANITNPNSQEPVFSFHEMLGYGPGDKVTFIYDRKQAGGFGGGLWINNQVQFIHGYIVRPKPGASPRAVADRDLKSTVHGHTHRPGENFREILIGILSAYEIGMLVNPNHSMMSYADLLNNWHPAFMAAEVVNGKIMGNVVPIVQVEHEIGRRKYVFTFDGKLYKAADRS